VKETIDHGPWSHLYHRITPDGEQYSVEIGGWVVTETPVMQAWHDQDGFKKSLAGELRELIGELTRYTSHLAPVHRSALEQEVADAIERVGDRPDGQGPTPLDLARVALDVLYGDRSGG